MEMVPAGSPTANVVQAMDGPMLVRVAQLAEKKVATADALTAATEALKKRIDPFHLHLQQPLMDQCRARYVTRCSLLLGCFTQLRASQIPQPPSIATSDTQGMLLPIAPVCGRFALLPTIVSRHHAPVAASTTAVSRRTPTMAVFSMMHDVGLGGAYYRHR